MKQIYLMSLFTISMILSLAGAADFVLGNDKEQSQFHCQSLKGRERSLIIDYFEKGHPMGGSQGYQLDILVTLLSFEEVLEKTYVDEVIHGYPKKNENQYEQQTGLHARFFQEEVFVERLPDEQGVYPPYILGKGIKFGVKYYNENKEFLRIEEFQCN